MKTASMQYPLRKMLVYVDASIHTQMDILTQGAFLSRNQAEVYTKALIRWLLWGPNTDLAHGWWLRVWVIQFY